MPSPSVPLTSSTLYKIDSPKVDSEGESLPVSDSDKYDNGEGDPNIWRLTNKEPAPPGPVLGGLKLVYGGYLSDEWQGTNRPFYINDIHYPIDSSPYTLVSSGVRLRTDLADSVSTSENAAITLLVGVFDDNGNPLPLESQPISVQLTGDLAASGSVVFISAHDIADLGITTTPVNMGVVLNMASLRGVTGVERSLIVSSDEEVVRFTQIPNKIELKVLTIDPNDNGTISGEVNGSTSFPIDIASGGEYNIIRRSASSADRVAVSRMYWHYYIDGVESSELNPYYVVNMVYDVTKLDGPNDISIGPIYSPLNSVAPGYNPGESGVRWCRAKVIIKDPLGNNMFEYTLRLEINFNP